MNMRRLPILKLIVVCLLINGCATREWQVERSACESRSYSMYPVNMVLAVVQRSRFVQVSDGIRCANDGAIVQCSPTYRQEVQLYDSKELVDTNASARKEFVDRCTRAECLRIYGNEDCDTGRSTSERSR
jgi:hypothetical protein